LISSTTTLLSIALLNRKMLEIKRKHAQAMPLKEKITPLTIIAITLAFFGVALVVKAYETSWFNSNILGLTFGMLTSPLFALYFLMAKKLREHC
jgi:drug/metabolite transporter (DMT)-like permease